MDAALLKGKRSEVLKALATHLQERDDDTALELLHELLEISNMQFTLVADAVADATSQPFLCRWPSNTGARVTEPVPQENEATK